jgi:hypothetical protein
MHLAVVRNSRIGRHVQLRSERRSLLVHADDLRADSLRQESGAPFPEPHDHRTFRLATNRYVHWNAFTLLIASKASFAFTWVAFTWPYQTEPPEFDWIAA